jgi:hypothetical protein
MPVAQFLLGYRLFRLKKSDLCSLHNRSFTPPLPSFYANAAFWVRLKSNHQKVPHHFGGSLYDRPRNGRVVEVKQAAH